MTGESWALLCEIGFWGWVLSATGFILLSFPARDLFRCGKAMKWGGSFLVCYALWIVGMINA